MNYKGHDWPINVENAYQRDAGEIFIELPQNAEYNYIDYNGKGHQDASSGEATTKRAFK